MGFNSGFKGLKRYMFRTVMLLFSVQVSGGRLEYNWTGGLWCEGMLCLPKYGSPYTRLHHTIQTQNAINENALFITDSTAFAQVYKKKR